jgi:hypothetical protein
MAFNLSYDPNQDPELQDDINQSEQEALEVGERLAEEQGELLAGKFQSAEDLEAAYLELQSAFSRRNQQPEADESEEDEQADIDSLVETLRAEFEQYGQLTQETADELGEDVAEQVEAAFAAESDEEEPSGVPLTAEETSQVQGIVGGPQEYQQMIEWSAENLSEAEQDAYNQVMDSGNLNAIYWAVKGLQAQFVQDVGTDGRLIQGKAPSSRGDSFRSMAELVRAQSDARYDNDPAYRADVLAKLERSGDLL